MRYYWQKGIDNGILVRFDKDEDDGEMWIDFTFLKKNPLFLMSKKRLDKKYGPILLKGSDALKFLEELRDEYYTAEEICKTTGNVKVFEDTIGGYETQTSKLHMIDCSCISKCTLMPLKCCINDDKPFDRESNPQFDFFMYRLNRDYDKKEQSYVSLSPNQFLTFLNVCINGLTPEEL